jgi:hypothetical protein
MNVLRFTLEIVFILGGVVFLVMGIIKKNKK